MTLLNTSTFQGNKLKFIRELKMETITSLGEILGVSHQLVSAWENGKKTPTFEWLLKLSDFFSVDRKFFFIPLDVEMLDGDVAFFRKKAAVTKKNQTQAKRELLKFMSLEKQVNNFVELPNFNYPSFATKRKTFTQIDFYEIEELSWSLRELFKLGSGPISNVTLLCEKMGIRVHFADISSSQIDAATTYVLGKPVILLNNDRVSSSVRIRFNLAHELGHILLHSGYTKTILNDSSKNKRIEAEANYFASCLLLPEEGFLLDLTSTNMEHLLQLKKHWKVSLQAIIYRAVNMGILAEKQSLFLYQQISRNKWRKSEPYDDLITIEYPTLLKIVLSSLEEKNIKWSEIISDATGYFDKDIISFLSYDKKLTNTNTNKSNLRLL